MGKIIADYPDFARNRGPGFWVNPSNLWAARRKLRRDRSSDWRAALHSQNPVDPAHSVPVEKLLESPDKPAYSFIVLADSGEGDKSQYGLLPLIRALEPDFMIINGDVAYPAGNTQDFEEGFFAPYRNLKIPIWATPGNHEYYSEKHGTEFYETFCTWTRATQWSSFGLHLVPQPGMFWEIRDDTARKVILGIDSGMTGNLDGKDGAGNIQQHTWLTARLATAQALGYSAMAMFHIPGLVNGKHAKETHLDQLHRTLTMFPCLRLVLTGHEHSFQKYSPEVFSKYVYRDGGQPTVPPDSFPHYMVSGGGGAYLASTAWFGSPQKRKKLDFDCAPVCVDNWEQYKRTHRPLKVNLGHSAMSRLVGAIDEAILDDADVPDMMSFVLVEVNRANKSARATPIFQKDFEALFANLQDGTRVDVQAGVPAPDPQKVADCRQQRDSVTW